MEARWIFLAALSHQMSFDTNRLLAPDKTVDRTGRDSAQCSINLWAANRSFQRE